VSDTEDVVRYALSPTGWVELGSVYIKPLAQVPPDAVEVWEAAYEVCSQYGVPVGAHAHRIEPDRTLTGSTPERRELWETHPPPWRTFGSWYTEDPHQPER